MAEDRVLSDRLSRYERDLPGLGCLGHLTLECGASSVLDMDTNTPEGKVKALLIEKGMQEHEAGTLAFDLVWAADAVDMAEDAIRNAHAKREELIVVAAGQGLSFRQIAEIVRLSHQRVAQIVTGDQR